MASSFSCILSFATGSRCILGGGRLLYRYMANRTTAAPDVDYANVSRCTCWSSLRVRTWNINGVRNTSALAA
jgi:hypothetical protein